VDWLRVRPVGVLIIDPKCPLAYLVTIAIVAIFEQKGKGERKDKKERKYCLLFEQIMHEFTPQ